MNPINRFFLRLALLPQRAYRRLGVDTVKLKAILDTKLLMDDRRPPSLNQMRRRKEGKPLKRATIGTMIVSALMGLFYLLLFSLGNDIVTQLTLYFTIFFVMLSLTLIADFTSVLIDVRDTFIILPKPVNDRTVVVARLLHIFIHICKVVLPMSLPAMVFMTTRYGPGGLLLFIPLVFLLTAFSIFFINALYIAILKLTTPQKFQSVISYVQVFFAVAIYGGYQVFPRMLNRLNFDRFDIATLPWIGFYPVYWLAETWKRLYSFSGTQLQWLYAFLGVAFPLLGVWIVVRYLAPSFNRKLALITASTSGDGVPSPTRKRGRLAGGYVRFWSRMVSGSQAERAAFAFTWKMTGRSRDFKLKVYPSMGYLLVYVGLIVFGNRRITYTELDANDTATKVIVLSALYFTTLLLNMAIGQMVYSEKYKASWLFYATPLDRPGTILSGATKAVIVKFYVPIVLVLSAAALAVAGPLVLPNIVLGLFNQVLIAAITVYLGHKYFPFSTQQSMQVKTGAFLRGLATLAVSGLIAFGHFFLYDVMPAVLLCMVLSVIATWLLFDSLKRTSWEKIRSSYAEE